MFESLITPPGSNRFNNTFGTAPSAVLYIMSPRRYSAQAKRPMLYQFDAAFVDAADNAVSRRAEQHNKSMMQHMTSSPEYLRSVFASAMPEHVIDMRAFEQNWTFLLVVTNDKSGPGGLIRSSLDNQHFYYGCFTGEPVNPHSHLGRVTLNPDAIMMVTHRTQVNKTSSVGAYGVDHRLINMSDIDIIYPSMVGGATHASTRLMRPEDLYTSTSDGPDRMVMHSEGSMLERQENPVPINSNLSVPRHNIDKILGAVAHARGAILSNIAAGDAGYDGFGALGLERDTYRTLVESNLQDNARLFDMGLQLNSVVTLKSVMDRYHPTAEVIMQDQNPHYNPIDQTTGSARNVFASMISSIVPAMMSEFLLADISFSYDSHRDEFTLFPNSPPASISPMHPDKLKFQINGFFFRLKSEVMPILKSNHGDFNLLIQSSAGGVTHVTLNFYDDTIRSNEVFEVPTIFGGLNSSLIGTSGSFDRNANEISSLIGSLVENHRDQPPLNIYDEKQFGGNLLSYDNSNGVPPLPVNTSPPSNRWNI